MQEADGATCVGDLEGGERGGVGVNETYGLFNVEKGRVKCLRFGGKERVFGVALGLEGVGDRE